jgi:hypothetical protein
MSWFGEPKDLIAIVIATLAVILSLVTVLVQKGQQQRDAYRQIYDVLMSAELHRGRWMIVDIGEGKIHLPEPDSPEFFLIYRTLGVFDALATYTRHRIVPSRLVLKVWRHPLLDMRRGAEAIRTRHTDWKPWEDLWWLFDRLPAKTSFTPPTKETRTRDSADEP